MKRSGVRDEVVECVVSVNYFGA